MKARTMSVLFGAPAPFIHGEVKRMIWLSPCPQFPDPKDLWEHLGRLQLSGAHDAQEEDTGEKGGGATETRHRTWEREEA